MKRNTWLFCSPLVLAFALPASQIYAAPDDAINNAPAAADANANVEQKRFHVKIKEPNAKQRSQLKNRQYQSWTKDPKSTGARGMLLNKYALNDFSESLVNAHNTMYYGNFTIGSDQQKFNGILDTGSSNIWVPSVYCNSFVCESKDQFNPDSSSTFTTEYEELSIQYGSGEMEGVVGNDTVSMAGLTVNQQGFGLATELSENFYDSGFDGIFGLAYRNIASDQITPWLDNAVAQGVVDNAIFSFYLSNNPGRGDARLIIGQPDPAYYQGEIHWQPMQALSGYEQVDMYYNIMFEGIASGDNEVELTCQRTGGCHAIVDSGTSLIVGPEEDIEDIMNTLTLRADCSNIKDQPSLNFKIGGKNHTVPPEFYVVKRSLGNGQYECSAGLSPSNMGFWIFGDAFMRAFYTVFDKENSRVGFAELADRLQKPQELRTVYN